MDKQQAQYIADYINHGRGAYAEQWLADTAWLKEWEVEASMILDALATWTDQRDKGE